MSQIPSIKGSVLSGNVELLLKLMATGEISRSELARRLPPEDLALVDQPANE